MTKNIYLVGFMGSGKTTVGRALAKTLDRLFVDTDEFLEIESGLSIPEMFYKRGEAFFRSAETELIARMAGLGGTVIATGGGLPETEINRHLMRQTGMVVYLAADLETCISRITPEQRARRPLWTDIDALRKLFERRQAAYSDCHLMIAVKDRKVEDIVYIVERSLLAKERFSMKLGSSVCHVAATHHPMDELADLAEPEKVVVITDTTVYKLHGARHDFETGPKLRVELRPGEGSKTLRQADRVYQALIESGCDKDDLLVAIGGGVITDLGAFVAATYKRGMRFVLVSTSLLGCVDAAIGGKAAVNVGPVKNVVGCFTVPERVILDLGALGTLKHNHLQEGLIEAYKTGLVAAPTLADVVERKWVSVLRNDPEVVGQVAVLSAKAKASVVSGDFREEGMRRILNFGHTVGHAIEGMSDYKTSHGAAVAAGMICAVELSRARGLLEGDLAHGIVSTVRKIFPELPVLPKADRAWDIMRQDKKVRGGKVVFVLLEDIGKPVFADDVSRKELAAALKRAR